MAQDSYEDGNMGRAINPEMYEGNAARRIPERYTEPVYDKREKERSGRSAGGERRTAWKEPVYGGTGERRTAWKEPVYGGAGGRRTARREPVYESRSRESAYSGQRRRTGNGRKRSRIQNRKRMQRRILRGLCIYFLLAGVIATCWMIIHFFFGRDGKVHAEEAGNADSKIVSEEACAEGDIDAKAGLGPGGMFVQEITPEIRQECQNLYAGRESLLLLVNKEHELPASAQPALRSICKGRLEAADILYEDLCAMLEAAGREGYQFWIASAWRDREYQQGLVDEDVQKYMAKGYSYEAALEKTHEYTMPAGQSEHETGLALDILCSTNTIMDESQKSEPGNRWLVQHCHEYGFILRYPEEKEEITGIGYEPWHFRYVGKEAAAYLTQKGWTLEEFHQVLES